MRYFDKPPTASRPEITDTGNTVNVALGPIVSNKQRIGINIEDFGFHQPRLEENEFKFCERMKQKITRERRRPNKKGFMGARKSPYDALSHIALVSNASGICFYGGSCNKNNCSLKHIQATEGAA